MPASPFRPGGIITALATPFDARGEVDFEAWQILIEQQLQGGIAALVVAGSTGEAAALEDEEYDTLLRTAVAHVAGRVPVIAGTGLANTGKTLIQTRHAAALGADAALVVTPPYVRPTQAGLMAHYRALADAAGLPLLLYNVPTRTGCDMLPETVAELAAHPAIIGIKEAVAAPARMQALLALQSPEFAVLSGDDPSACRALLAGADGLISVASNVVPHAMSRLYQLVRQGEHATACALDARMQPLFDFLGCAPNPIPLKALLHDAGIGHGLRLPLLPLGDEHVPRLAEARGAILALERDCQEAA